MRDLAHAVNHAYLVQRAHVRRQPAVHAQHAAIDHCLHTIGRVHAEVAGYKERALATCCLLPCKQLALRTEMVR